jgi:hypothetical protein
MNLLETKASSQARQYLSVVFSHLKVGLNAACKGDRRLSKGGVICQLELILRTTQSEPSGRPSVESRINPMTLKMGHHLESVACMSVSEQLLIVNC